MSGKSEAPVDVPAAVWKSVPRVERDDLRSFLGGQDRVYHGMGHVWRMLSDGVGLEGLIGADGAAGPLGYAIVYHDAVFDPHMGVGVNEEASARLWEEDAASIARANPGFRPEWKASVARAIRATGSHGRRPDDLEPWQHALLDLDLGGIGLSYESFRTDEVMLLAEGLKSGVAHAETTRRNRAFLEALAASPRIFHHALRGREAAARANVARRLAAPDEVWP